ncbi:MAG: LuxR C-terminal-related transcriptional regulator [Pseudooceanicola sp.]
MTIRIVMADDHRIFLGGLEAIFAQDPEIEILGTAGNGIQAISLIKRTRPDIALVDLAMPGATGREVLAEARRWSPDTRFIILTGTVQANLLRDLEAAGVAGLFLKSAPVEELKQGILDVAEGGRAISDAAARLFQSQPALPHLSPRESEVLHAIARGLSNPQIAEHLHISPKTVDSHRTSLLAKMGVRSTAALLVAAMRSGLIDLTPDPEEN